MSAAQGGTEGASSRAMTRPYPVHAGTTYAGARRCSERRFFLTPSSGLNKLVKYCLAWAADRNGIELHGYCVMSNHVHPVYTDPHGRDPDFRRDFHSILARARNAQLGRSESLWCPPANDVTELVDEGAQVAGYAYALANPVKDGLVMYGYQWPGLRSKPKEIGKVEHVRRPSFFFDSDGLPAIVELRLTVPPALQHMPREKAIRVLEDAVQRKETEERRRHLASGGRFAGRRRVRRTDPFSSPTTRQTVHSGTNPRIKCADVGARKRALDRLRVFWEEHERARQRYLRGDAEVVFPAGTYAMRLLAGVPCVPS